MNRLLNFYAIRAVSVPRMSGGIKQFCWFIINPRQPFAKKFSVFWSESVRIDSINLALNLKSKSDIFNYFLTPDWTSVKIQSHSVHFGKSNLTIESRYRRKKPTNALA